MAAHPLGFDLALGAALRDARHRARLSQIVAAVRAGVAVQTVGRAERYGAASTRPLSALAHVYGVTVDELRGRRSESGGAA